SPTGFNTRVETDDFSSIDAGLDPSAGIDVRAREYLGTQDTSGIDPNADLAFTDSGDANTRQQAFPNSNGAGGNVVSLSGSEAYRQRVYAHQNLLERRISSRNIAIDENFDQTTLNEIGMKVKREYDIDYLSCDDWREAYFEYLDFALQVAEEKTYPWPQASNIIFPLITTASIQFAARAYPAIISGPYVVKGIVVGTDHGNPVIDPQS